MRDRYSLEMVMMNLLGTTMGLFAATLLWTSIGAGLAPITATIQDDEASPAEQDLTALFEKSGIHFDLDRQLCSFGATVEVRNDLLEYLLVARQGAAHESLFVTETKPAVLNTALLALGVKPGSNASWTEKDPPPSEEELAQGAVAYEVQLPQGDGFYLYAAWKQDDELFLYRIEDLLRNLRTGRSMKRHEWVYLGSRMIEWRKEKEKVFAADVLGNLINISFFEAGDTLLTGAIDDCVDQSIWMPNAWIVPERGARVEFIFTRKRISELSEELSERLPESKTPAPPDLGR